MVPSFIQFRSLATDAASAEQRDAVLDSARQQARETGLVDRHAIARATGCAESTVSTVLRRFQSLWLLPAVMLTLAAAPTEPVKPRCSFMYINGDLVISCPKAGR